MGRGVNSPTDSILWRVGGELPHGSILSAVEMLRHLSMPEASARLDEALRFVLAQGRVLPADLGGSASTTAFAKEVALRL